MTRWWCDHMTRKQGDQLIRWPWDKITRWHFDHMSRLPWEQVAGLLVVFRVFIVWNISIEGMSEWDVQTVADWHGKPGPVQGCAVNLVMSAVNIVQWSAPSSDCSVQCSVLRNAVCDSCDRVERLQDKNSDCLHSPHRPEQISAGLCVEKLQVSQDNYVFAFTS